MAYNIIKETGEIHFGGWEKGIAPSPHKGIANIQNGNISTESGEVMASFDRALQSQLNYTLTGTFTPLDGSHLVSNMTAPATLVGGIWVSISASTITGLAAGNYYVLSSASAGTSVQLSSTYNGSAVSGLGATGSATFSLIRNVGKPIASATEIYSNGTAFRYRYYVLDANGLVWIQDSAVSTAGVTWFLPDTAQLSNATGIAVLNGWVLVFAGNTIWCKPTVLLGGTPGWSTFATGIMSSPATSPNTHFAYVGHQGRCYYTDGNFIGSIFPSTSLLTGVANIQSYALWASSGGTPTVGTITTLIGGSLPYTTPTTTRIPVAFFTDNTLPATLVAGTIYYVLYSAGSANFQVFTAATGGAALDINTGAVGNQWFNTFYPTSASGEQTITFTPQRLTLPVFETSQAITEIGNTIIIGGNGNALYPWNQVDTTPQDIITLPESNTSFLLTVNNMAYSFTGNKGNIYITNGSTASLVLTVPDYCAGVPGTPSSYIEPYFTWGGAMYLRGRVYFSLLDQTSTKAGNCGGVWSFIPTQNFYIGQDTGLSLRLENQNSYGTYNGYATILLRSENQAAISPQYWAGWQSSINSPTYGIDFTAQQASTVCVVETDLAPTGTLLDKKTFEQIEYKLSAPLASGESIAIRYRLNATDAWSNALTLITESSTALSGYATVDFEKSQWLQIQASLTPNGVVGSSTLVRLQELIVR